MKYRELMAANVRRNVSELLRKKIIERNGSKYVIRADSSPNNLWLKYFPETDKRQCTLWMVYFNYYDMIPEGCRNCWKVVMTMDTLEQMMQIKELQENMRISAKCGPETRPFTGKLGSYGAYWYVDLFSGLAGARELYRKIVSNVTPLMRNCEGNFTIILKRGCTEMEKRFGDSSKWDQGAKIWNERERLLNTVFELGSVDLDQHPMDVIDIMAGIYEYAYEHGDPTYTKFAGQDFGFYPKQYQDNREINSDDFICTLKGGGDDRGRLEIL